MNTTRLCAVAIAAMASATPCHSAFRIRAEDVGSGVGTVITDNLGGDINATPNAVVFIGAVGLITFNLEIGTHGPLGSPFDLLLTSVNATATGPATLRVTLEADDFAFPPAPSVLAGYFSGVSGGVGTTVTGQAWWHDSAIPLLGPDQAVGPIGAIGGIPAGSVPAFPVAPIVGPPIWSVASLSPGIIASDPDAIFAQAIVAFGPTGGTTSFQIGAAHVIPEARLPVGLMALALAGWAWRRR
jgi:hypothetical protein